MGGAPPPPVGLPETGYPSALPRPRRWGLLVLSALGVIALVLAAIFATAMSISPPMGPVTSATYGLNATYGSFAFPNCAVVSVSWADLDHHQIGFGVGTGEAIYASDCRGPPNSANEGCPPGSCQPGRASAGGGPIEWENATQGWFQFTATQPGYGFFEDSANSTSPSYDPIQFTVSYSTPIIPAS